MHQPPRRRSAFGPVAIAMALALALPAFVSGSASADQRTVAPHIAWRLDQTHHVREQRRERRMTVVIHRRETRQLEQARIEGGIRGVQETLWDRGSPPAFRVCPSWGGPCINRNESVRIMDRSIFSQRLGLRLMLRFAMVRNECLGLLLMEQGRRVNAWTTVSCSGS